ncbi:MAG: hypothetical protein WCF19_03055 [Chlamydiales bacterium]
MARTECFGWRQKVEEYFWPPNTGKRFSRGGVELQGPAKAAGAAKYRADLCQQTVQRIARAALVLLGGAYAEVCIVMNRGYLEAGKIGLMTVGAVSVLTFVIKAVFWLNNSSNNQIIEDYINAKAPKPKAS